MHQHLRQLQRYCVLCSVCEEADIVSGIYFICAQMPSWSVPVPRFQLHDFSKPQRTWLLQLHHLSLSISLVSLYQDRM